MLQGEHSAIFLTCTKLPFVIKISVLSIIEWPFCTGFTVLYLFSCCSVGVCVLCLFPSVFCWAVIVAFSGHTRLTLTEGKCVYSTNIGL